MFLFSTIYYATADIPVSSDNFPTQEDICRYNLAVVRFSYCFLSVKKDFKVAYYSFLEWKKTLNQT